MKKFLAMLMAVAMMLSLAACGGSSSSTESSSTEESTAVESTATEESEAAESEASEESEAAESEESESSDSDEVMVNLDYSSVDLTGYTIGYVTINSSAPWGGRVGTEFEAYAESCGATVNVLDANTDADLVTQYCQQMIDNGVDALVVFGGDPSAMSEIAAVAYEAGIPLFLCALDADSETAGYEYVTAMIGPDQYQMCAGIAAYVVEENGTDTDYDVYEINGVPFLQDYIDRTSGFETYMADYANYTLGNVVDAYSSRTDAKAFVENWITAGLGAGDIIMGYDDDLTMGAVQALEEAGLTGEVKVYSLTGQADAIQAVINGQMQLTVMNRADSIAAGTVTAIAEYFETGTTARFQRCELTFITAENAAEYLDQAEF
ncbi:MAG: sugar ABC transporter substrate-binding protein [Oscillospiraceae bacterium]|nr:sugar ABC transporter substrate-binding protein [Oscillospiraceae bacterium]